MNKILDFGIQDLQELYQKQEFTPLEVIDQHIAHLENVNPKINAICETDFDLARSRAQKQTENFLKLKKLPLFGIPFSIKEMIAYENFKLTAGSVHRKFNLSKKSATVVTRCLEAGGIPLVTTNVPEIGFWWETTNPIYGRTSNPYDLQRTCGGSSGGEAALISARGTVFGIGSDIGGSIRNPSSFCGIAGHKPSNKLIPLTGHFLQDQADFAEKGGSHYPYTCLGPLARKAQDLPLLIDIMSGPDGIDPEVTTQKKLAPLLEDFSKLKVYVLDEPIFHLASPASAEMSEAVRTAANLFEQYGATIEKLPARLFKNAVEHWAACMRKTESLPKFEEVLSPQGKVRIAKEFWNFIRNKEDYTLPSLITVALERLDLSSKDLDKKYNEAQEMRQYLQQLLKQDSILILPPMSRVAPKHNAALLTPFDFIYCGAFNAYQLPATIAPIKLNEEGLPVAVQIVAGPRQDHLSLSAAIMIEKTFGSLTPPEL